MAAQLIAAHANDLAGTHIVNVRHAGAVPGIAADWVLELPATVRRHAITPLSAPPLPAFAFGLLAALRAYELLTIQAAVTGDRDAAYQSLIAHPLGPHLVQAEAVLEDMLETNRAYCRHFFA